MKMEKINVVLSIKPEYSEKIMLGVKTVELRRRFPSSFPAGSIAYIYSTSPIKAMVGVVEITKIEKLPVGKIWEKYSQKGYIEKKDFNRYFDGQDFGMVIHLDNPSRYSEAISLVELRRKFNFTPPQSFSYARDSLVNGLSNNCSDMVNNIF